MSSPCSVPVVRNRADVEEIALRLERCFDEPFAIESHVLQGSASVGIALYPEDASTKRLLLALPTPPCIRRKTSRKAEQGSGHAIPPSNSKLGPHKKRPGLSPGLLS